MTTQLTTPEKERVELLYEAGWTHQEIADDVAHGRVYDLMRDIREEVNELCKSKTKT